MFTARYGLIPYINRLRLVFKRLVKKVHPCTGRTAHRESRGIALLFLYHGTRRGEGLASCSGRSLPSGKTRHPLYRRLCGPQDRSGQVRKILPPPGFGPRTVQSVASRYADWATRLISDKYISHFKCDLVLLLEKTSFSKNHQHICARLHRHRQEGRLLHKGGNGATVDRALAPIQFFLFHS